MNERREAETTLRAGGWFSTLPPEIRSEMLNVGVVRSIASGSHLFEEDGEPTGLHGVLSGSIHIVGLSPDGNAVTMGIIRPGDWSGFLSCIDGLPHAYAGIAREGARTFSLRPADVARIFERDVPTFKLLLAPDLAIRRKLGRYVVDDLGMSLARRVAARLCDLGRSPYQFQIGPVASLRNISQEELAMSVAATRPRINEILHDFVARGLIELGYGRITIINAPALEYFAQNS
jgi:CRP/FNR family transcriptional regulator